MPACELGQDHIDLVVFSLAFSGALAPRYCDLGLLFVFFYTSFHVLRITAAVNCT